MEEFFDFREFMVNILKKFKLVLILALILGLLGAIFGYVKGVDHKFTTTTSASVNIKDIKVIEGTALESVMRSIKDTVSGSFFYTGIYNYISDNTSSEEYDVFFNKDKHPSIEELKEIIKINVNGNLVLTDAIVVDEKLSVKVSSLCRQYVIEQLSNNINNVELKEQAIQTVNTSLQNGDTPKKKSTKYGLLGFGGGIVLAILWIFFVDVMSLKVKCADDLKKYNIPVLGEVTESRVK